MIEVSELVKNYGSKKALKGISFTVGDNEILGLIGPNGAGKSTIMNIMTGYISMTSGTVKIGGTDILDDPVGAKRKIGYLPEVPPLYPEMTVGEYLRFAAKLKSAPLSDAEQAAGRTGAGDVIRRRCANLSKGYRQRVGFACALLGDPEVIILDEPTAGLDPNQIAQMRELISELGKSHTVILSSHILSEVGAVCDKVLIINDGAVVAEDTPAHLAQREREGMSRRVIIKTEKDAADVLDALEDASYEVISEREYAVTGKDERLSQRLFFAFAEAGIAILSQREDEASLEDAFMELTRSDGNESNI